MPRRRITVGFAAGEEPTLTLETKIRNSRDASVRQCYSKRRTDELKPPDAQTVALGSPAELSRNPRMNPKKKTFSAAGTARRLVWPSVSSVSLWHADGCPAANESISRPIDFEDKISRTSIRHNAPGGFDAHRR